MIRLTQRLAALSTFALLGVAPIAHAQTTYFPNDTTISNTVPFDATVGYANQNDFVYRTNPTSPTVSLINNGSVGNNLEAYNSSTVNLSGGSIGGYLYALNSSTVNLSGGSVSGGLEVFTSSTVNLSGGSIGYDLYAYASSTVNLSGGSVGYDLVALGSSTVNLSGGSIGGFLFAVDSSVLNIFGHDLVAPLTDPNAFGGADSLYYLSGTLLDGTVLTKKNLYIQNGTGARFNLTNLDNNAVPEPGSLALLVGVGVLPLLALRRRRSGN